MSDKRALIVQGGWPGHRPAEVAAILADALAEERFAVEVSDTLDRFADPAALARFDLIVPHWTMGTIAPPQLQGLLDAVRAGAGLAGLHGGAGDAFRNEPEYQFMLGGQFVAHPGGDRVTYQVRIADRAHPITAGLSDFWITSEQYYLHVDPAIHVLATTSFGDVTMPVAWTKRYGAGRVFYCSIGHRPEDVRQPEVLAIVRRGMLWAAR